MSVFSIHKRPYVKDILFNTKRLLMWTHKEIRRTTGSVCAQDEFGFGSSSVLISTLEPFVTSAAWKHKNKSCTKLLQRCCCQSASCDLIVESAFKCKGNVHAYHMRYFQIVCVWQPSQIHQFNKLSYSSSVFEMRINPYRTCYRMYEKRFPADMMSTYILLIGISTLF